MGILTVLFNKQIMKYLGADALAVYGPVINVSTFVQCCAYSVGQAAQPIISTNFGALRMDKIRETLRYTLYTVAFFGIFWAALSLVCPNLYIKIFMKPTERILKIAPQIIRRYSVSFLLLPLNIFATYCFRAILKAKTAFKISIMRGPVISGALIMILPALFEADFLWFAMPVTELAIMFYAVYMLTYSVLSVQEIASVCGFDDALYFSRAFKRHTGISPGDFIALNRV